MLIFTGVNLNQMGECFPFKSMFVSFMYGSKTQDIDLGQKGKINDTPHGFPSSFQLLKCYMPRIII